MAKEEIQFVDGMMIRPPHENAPSFVKARISIKVEDLGKWLREKYKAGEQWVNIDVNESKGGTWYAKVSTFKPEPKEGSAPAPKKAAGGGMEDDIPFSPLRKLESSAL